MNTTLELLKKRRSYREFDKSYQLPKKELQEILDAARQAPTWMNGQFYSIIVLTEDALRKQLVEWNPSNPQIAQSSVFLLFVADLNRTYRVSQVHQSDYLVEESIEPLLIATTDAALALENAIIAAESLSLGSVVVGSIRKHGPQISQLLDLPERTFPLFGLSIGRPITEMKVKPRLPEAAVVHYNRYQPYPYTLIDQYDQVMNTFAEARETKAWSKKFADFFAITPAMITDQLVVIQKIYSRES